MQLSPAGEPDEWEFARVRRRRVLPGVREPVRAREVENSHGRFGCVRADDLEADPLDALQRLATGDERGEEKVAQLGVLVEEQTQRGSLDGDVPQRLDHERADEHRLPREEVQLAEEAGGAVPDDLVPCCVDDRDLSFEDRHERIAPIPDPIQQLTGTGRALLADLGESRQLRRGKKWARRC